MIIKSQKLLQSSNNEKINNFLKNTELNEEVSDMIYDSYENMLDQNWIKMSLNGHDVIALLIDIVEFAEKEIIFQAVLLEKNSLGIDQIRMFLDNNSCKIIDEISEEEVFQKMDEFKADMMTITSAIKDKTPFTDKFVPGKFYKNTFGRFGTYLKNEENKGSCNNVAYIGPEDHRMYLEEPKEIMYIQLDYMNRPHSEHSATVEEYEKELENAFEYFKNIEFTDDPNATTVADN